MKPTNRIVLTDNSLLEVVNPRTNETLLIDLNGIVRKKTEVQK